MFQKNVPKNDYFSIGDSIMASISIFDLDSKIVASDLTDKELEKISGGSCTYAGLKYGDGAVVKQGDGNNYRCNVRLFRSDVWRKV